MRMAFIIFALYYKLIRGMTPGAWSWCAQRCFPLEDLLWYPQLGVGPLCLPPSPAYFVKHFPYVSASHTATGTHQRPGKHFAYFCIPGATFMCSTWRSSINTCPTELDGNHKCKLFFLARDGCHSMCVGPPQHGTHGRHH